MKTNEALFLSGVTLVAVAGWALSQDKVPSRSSRPTLASPHETQSPVPGKTVKTAADYPVICYIEQRHHTITVKAGPKGPLYSVRAADGKLLYENLSLGQLSAQAPEVGKFLKSAVVGAPGAKADARLRVNVDATVRDMGLR